jgi:hypothetical protein
MRNEAGRYFVTRLHAPDTEGSTKTWEDDRKDEAKILGNQPWCQTEKQQLGTKNLTLALSRRLAEMIKRRYFPLTFW